ncbi:ferritin-like domain-containing protein [Pseudonocardia sp. NPDC049635]|uniref:ferritin-like domain-containing protein n=1 Tax=Pseudonocardia sp. NPDC049635 TaxID=3155506 RepID=UPI0033EBCE62
MNRHLVPAQDGGGQDGTEQPSAQVAKEALQRSLAGEHAAIWAYSTALAFLPPDAASRARTELEAHRTLRREVSEALTELGERPVSAQPAYTPPQPVVDELSASALLVTAETDAAAAWRSLVERAPSREMRQAGLTRMIESTVRCAFWRRATDRSPAIPVFPGRS